MEHFECHVCRNSKCCKAREILGPRGDNKAWCYVCWNEKYNSAFTKKRDLSDTLEQAYAQTVELNYHIPNFYGETITQKMMKAVEDAHARRKGWTK